ncbi:hypothetical protein L916_01211 [Phytophthora nicotianae]|uniref:Uncharacterized protein n=1 Tax=Phytophthora nicotianae TaxID=4792 RepID=W2JSF0_PHYNI|nr:hypothetical protein L916_01211 [Phytophthora nicotianae]
MKKENDDDIEGAQMNIDYNKITAINFIMIKKLKKHDTTATTGRSLVDRIHTCILQWGLDADSAGVMQERRGRVPSRDRLDEGTQQ